MSDAPETTTPGEYAGGIIKALGELPSGAIVDEEALARMFNRCTTSVKRAVDRGELPPPVRMFGKPCWTAGAILSHVGARLETAKKNAERDATRLAKHFPGAVAGREGTDDGWSA